MTPPCFRLQTRLPLLAALLSTALPALAEERKAAPLRQAAIAGALYAQAVAAGDALGALSAAHLRKGAGLVADGDALPGWQAMLDHGRSLAGADAALLDLAADIEAEGARGVEIGPDYVIAQSLAGHSPVTTEYTYRGGQLAEVYVEGSAGANLDVTVHDAEGNLICMDRDPSHIAYCDWTPAHDGLFRVTVENRSDLQTDYVLITN